MNFLKYRLMEGAQGDGGAGGGAASVTYDFGKGADGNALPADTVTSLTAQAKELGLTAEQAPKFAAFSAKQSAAAKAAGAAPEKYTFAQVDGKDLPAEVQTELTGIAKELGLSQEQAAKFTAYELRTRADAAKETQSTLTKVQDGWKASIKADKDLGGANYDANAALGKKALEKFFPEVAKTASGFPFLDHPDVFRGLVAIGKAISADGDFVRNQGGSSGAADPAKAFYPTMAG